MMHRYHILLRFAAPLLLFTCIHSGSAQVENAKGPTAQKPSDPLHLVVFADFQCPYSAVEQQTLAKLAAEYGERLQIVWKQSPLPIHPTAEFAHRAALAAGRQGKWDAMANLLYANQTQQSSANVLSYAKHLHLDIARFEHDLNSPEIAAQVTTDRVEAQAFGVDSTPTLYIEGKRLVGLQSQATLKRIIDDPAASATLAGTQSVAPGVDEKQMETLASGNIVRGTASAPFTMVEFTDFQCPFCAAAAEPLRKLLESRGKQVRIVYRAFPLDFHPQANLAAEAAFAAGAQGKFWEMHDLLFANQHALSRPDLDRYAEQLGLNMQVFRDALETHRFAADVAEDRALGTKAGVTGTPAFFLNGEVVEGARTLPEFVAWVDAQQPSGAANARMRSPEPSVPQLIVSGEQKSATVTLSWFTDVRSTTAADQARLVRALLARSKGKMDVVFKPFPSASRADASLAAAALIAAQKHGKFWELYDALAARHDLLDKEKLAAIAKSISLDPSVLVSADTANQAELTAQIEDASRRGILGSPVVFLNDKRVDGLQRDAFYTAILDEELAGAATLAQR